MSLLLVRPRTTTGAGPPPPTFQQATFTSRIAWRPEQFNHVQNPGFETDTTGWSVGAGINAAGSTATRVTTDPYEGSANGRIVTAGTADSGANYDFGTTTFDRLPYTALVWLRRISGGHRAAVILGSEGTSANRARYDFRLTDQWQPYAVRWMPSTTTTDVQLAIVTGDDIAVTMEVDAVNVYTDRLSQLYWRGSSLGGWTSDGSVQAAAATSHTTTTSDSFGSGSSHVVSTSATSGSGVDYQLGAKFTSGRTYRFRVALRSVSGSTSCRIRFGASGDQTDDTVTMSTSWGWHTVDWTPGSDTYACIVTLSNASAAANVFGMDDPEVYEAADEVTLEELHTTQGGRFDGGAEPPGRISAVVLDPDKEYAPRYTSSTLSGAITTDRPFHVRAVYSNRLYPITYGTITELEPLPHEKKLRLVAFDGLGDLDVEIDRPFTSDRSYATARADALDWTPTDVTGLSPILDDRSLTTDSLESSTFYDGTDASESLLDYLAALNEATGTLHYAEPRSSAVRPWYYATVSRATQTDDTAGWVIDEDFQRLEDVSLRTESLVTRQRVSWQGYQSGDSETVAEATTTVPYLIYSSDEYGSSDRPEPEEVYRLKRVRGRKKRKRRKLKKVGTRWVDTLVPISVAAGERHTITVDFLVPMEDVQVTATGASATVTEVSPARVLIHIDAGTGGDTVTALSISAKAHSPLEEGEEVYTAWDAGTVREGNPIDNEYVPSRAAAAGLAEYHTWRYSASRFRPTIIDQHNVVRQLSVRIGDHVTLTASRWDISADRYVVRSIAHDITASGKEWETSYGLEELPSGGTWFTLDGGPSLGFDSSAVLAH